MRPRKPRRVHSEPSIVYFKPQGIPMKMLEEVVITIDEFEAFRLVDKDQISQTDAAKKMHISQPTINRLLTSARQKIATGITEGKAIRIEGGDYKLRR